MPQCVAVGRRGPICGVTKWIGIWMRLARAAGKLRATTCLAQTHNHLILIHSIKYNKTFMVLFTTTAGRVLGGPPTSICEQRPSATQVAPLCKPMCLSLSSYTPVLISFAWYAWRHNIVLNACGGKQHYYGACQHLGWHLHAPALSLSTPIHVGTCPCAILHLHQACNVT